MGLGRKVCSRGLGHMTNIAAMPIYGNTLQKLLQNRKADDLETWHVAFGIHVHQRWFKW